MTVMWRGKPVCIKRRTPEMIAAEVSYMLYAMAYEDRVVMCLSLLLSWS